MHKLIQYAWLIRVYLLAFFGRSRAEYQGGQPIITGKNLVFIPELAKALGGVNEALIVQKIYQWMLYNEKEDKRDHFIGGRWWSYNSYAEWQRTEFDWISVSTVKRIFQDMRKLGVLIGQPQRKGDARLWYTVDFNALALYLKESQGVIKRIPGPDSSRRQGARKSPTSKGKSSKGDSTGDLQETNIIITPPPDDDVTGTDPETGEMDVAGEGPDPVAATVGDGRDDGKLSPSKPSETPPPAPGSPSPAAVLLAGHGVTELMVTELVEQFSEMDIVQAVAHMGKQKTVDNPPGWIVDCLRGGWHRQPVTAWVGGRRQNEFEPGYQPGQYDAYLKT